MNYRFCKVSIPDGAEKCYVCQEWQSPKEKGLLTQIWEAVQKVLPLLATGLALLGIKSLSEIVPQNASDVTIVDISSTPSEWRYVLSNSGDRPAILGTVRLESVPAEAGARNGVDGHRSSAPFEEPSHSLLRANEDLIFEAKMSEHAEDSSALICRVLFEIWDHKADAPRFLRFERPCDTRVPAGSRASVFVWPRTPVALTLASDYQSGHLSFVEDTNP